jgi:hypothetical protein
MSLVKSGHEVVASMRDVHERNQETAGEFGGLGAKVIEMDVAQDNSVAVGVARALEAVGDLMLWSTTPGSGCLESKRPLPRTIGNGSST